MASTEAIDEAWSALLGAGLRAPKAWATDDGEADAARVWRELFADVPDAHLGEAVRAYLVEGRFWPTPAELRKLLPKREARVLQIVERCAIAEITDSAVRIGIIDRANAETKGTCGVERHCGCMQPGTPCIDAAVARTEELAREWLAANRRTA